MRRCGPCSTSCGVLLAAPALSAFADPLDGTLPDPGQGLRRLAFGLLVIGVATLAASTPGALILRRVGRA